VQWTEIGKAAEQLAAFFRLGDLLAASPAPRPGEAMSRSSPPRLESLADAADYLDGLINRERRPGFDYQRLDLRPSRALLDALGRPDDSLSVVHVAGSKGKGSTCLFVESILLALGESVGTFTSPHLESWVERFRLDGHSVDEALLVDAVERVRPPVERLRSGPVETRPSFFDVTTAVACLLFAEAGVDRALLEVGLGGRLDSTNVVSPAVTCITSIELEHTDKLGSSEAEIAAEKAGILKPGVVAVLGALGPDAERVIRTRAEEVGAPIRALGEDFRIESSARRVPRGPISADAAEEFRYVEPAGLAFDVALAAAGTPARLNAALAIACVRALDVFSPQAIAEAVPPALASRSLPGRVEILAADSRIVVDSAHTARSAEALARALERVAPKGYELLLSVSGDKDLPALLEPLLSRAQRVWTTRAEPTRSLAAEALAERVRACRPGIEVVALEDPTEACRRARAELGDGLVLCATGSVYLAGVARRMLARPRS
jgi:dihydrofolate synthase/folylpolyglutamate synthase